MTEILVTLPEGTECPARAYLKRECGISSGLWKRIKHSGTFAVNGMPVIAARTVLRAGDMISYELPVISSVIPEQLPLAVVYEDADLLVIDKSAGQLVHPTTKEAHGTVANAVLGLYAARRAPLSFHPCHRLDRNTTGLLLIAKHPEVQYQIARQDTLTREYLALIKGMLSPEKGCIDAPIARASYTDVSAPRPSPMDAPAAIIRDRGAGRPTKKERRRLDALRAAPSDIDIERILDGDDR